MDSYNESDKSSAMDSAINWHDPYTFTKDRIIYTQEQHHIPGVHALAYHKIK